MNVKKWILIGILAAVMVGFFLINPQDSSTPKEITGYDAAAIYNYKTKYVGDASKIGGLTSNLPYAQYKKGISLETESEPYAITVNYTLAPDDFQQIAADADNKIVQNAAVIFCLVDNVSTIHFRFDDSTSIHTYSFDREDLSESFGHDFREYASSAAKFKDEFLPAVSDFGLKTFREPEKSDIAAQVEKNLESIISSPKEASDPRAYIEAHQNEYHTILKMGDDALNYLLGKFAAGKADGLKAQIMMSLCQDILGDRNNVADGSFDSPTEWYEKLTPYTAKKLSPFKPQPKNKTEELVYSAALKKYGSDSASMTVVAPHIFDTYEKGNTLKIFATVYYSSFDLYGSNLSQNGGGVVPAAIIYTKNSDGTYIFKEYTEAMDGSYFQKSIEVFCAPKTGAAKAIMKHYSNYSDLRILMKENIIECLKQNGLTGISLKDFNGELTPLT